MATYLYCLLTPTNAPEPAPSSARGVGGEAVRVLSTAGLEAWVSTVPAPPAATVDAIRTHDAVVEAALATGRTPLPTRFGQTWASDADCIASLTDRALEFGLLLQQLDGLVEMTVCAMISWPSIPEAGGAAPPNVPPGRAYLEQLRGRVERERVARTALETFRTRISTAVGPAARGELAEVRAEGESLTLSVSYLVKRGDEAKFRRAVEQIGAADTSHVVVTGPRAPYAFTSRIGSTGRGQAFAGA